MKVKSLVFLLGAAAAPLAAEPLAAPVLERYEQMLVKTPEPGPAFDKIYQHYLETEGLDALAKHWTDAAAGGPDYWLLAALLADRRGKTDEALDDLLKAAAAGPNWRVFAALAAVQSRAGKLPEAVDSYKKAITLTPPTDAVAKLYRGLALSQQRLMDTAGAVETWQAYAKASPGDPFVLEEAGDALLEAARLDEAREFYQQLRDLKDADPARKLNAALKLAEVERLRGKKEEALKIYTQALAEAGEASWLQREVRARIERLFRADDDLPGLLKYYQERLKSGPGDIESSLRLSEALAELNRSEEALSVLRAAAEKAPENKAVHLLFAAALLAAERPADAEKTLAALSKLYPDDSKITERLGEAQWQSFKLGKGSKETATATWKSLAPDGADATAIQRLAEIYRAHDLKEETLAAYRQALALDPSASDRRERLAEYLVQIDRKGEAMTELLGMVSDGRASGETWLRLAKTQRRFGDNAAAKKSLKEGESFPERLFERSYLAWQIASEEKGWGEAETVAIAMRETARSEPEIERADDCLSESLRELRQAAAEIRDLLKRQATAPEAFSERDFRLLFILAYGTEDNGTAEYALIEGLKKFPLSPLLAKLDLAFARRANDIPRRIAALARLEKIEPQRAGDWMAERVRAYRDDQKWEEATKLASELVLLSPARPESHLMLADTLLGAQKLDDAIKALREAIRLSESPNQIRLRLADLYAGRGDFAEARALLEEAFEAEETPAGKLQLTRRLANAYLQQGKIDDLITKMRDRQKAENGGWRYALYLSEIYLMLQDNIRSMEELDKALSGKPDDPVLLKRLYSLAEQNSDSQAALRYARKLAQVEPSKENRAELGEALAEDGKIDEALALLKENAAEFLKDPSAWNETLNLLQTENKAGELASLLEGQLRANPDDWSSIMALARILMSSGQTEKAGALFWQVLALKEDPASAPVAPSPGRTTHSGGATGNQPSLTSMQMRPSVINDAYQQAVQILSGNSNQNVYRRTRYSSMGLGMSQPAATPSLTQAQDQAMVFLACLAIQDGREEEFVKRLQAALKDRPIEDRLAIYTLMQTPELALNEVQNLIASGSMNDTIANVAFQTIQSLAGNRRNNRTIATGISEEELKALGDKLSDQLLSGSNPQTILQRYQMLNALGKREEAMKLADGILAKPDPDDVMQLNYLMYLAIERKNFDRALQIREKLKASPQTSGSRRQFMESFGLAMQMMASDTHQEKGAELFVDDFLAIPTATSLYGFSGRNRQQYTWPQMRGSVAEFIPSPTQDLNLQQINTLRSFIGNNAQSTKALPLILQRLTARVEKEDSSGLRQAMIWLRWFSGQRNEAEAEMKALIARQPDDDLLINYALMLMENKASPAAANEKKKAEAQLVLGQVQAVRGDAFEIKTRLQFVLALKSKNEALSKEMALKMASLRLIGYEQNELVQEMNRLGLKDEAAKFSKKTASRVSNPGQRTQQTIEVMQQRMNEGKRDEVIPLALAVLSHDPFSRSNGNERYQQEQAMRALEKFGELKSFIEKLKVQLEAAPDSPRLNAQMAQALQIKEPKEAEPFYRKMTELRPNDAEWLQQLGNLLVQAKQYDEAMRLYDKVILENPTLLFSQGTNFLKPYRQTKSWQRLLDVIAKSPDPKPDPMNPNRQNLSYSFMNIGRELQRARPPVDPTELWLKGVRWDPNGATQLRPILAQSLQRAGRTDEARKIIEEAFFPPGQDASSAKVFVYNRQFSGNSLWNQTSSTGDGHVQSAAIRMMQLAQSMGMLSELIPRFQKMPPNPDGSEPAIMARLVSRDETVLPEIRQQLDKLKDVKPGSQQTGTVNPYSLRILSDELANWPKGRELAYQTLETSARVSKAFGSDRYSIMLIELELATMALTDNRPDVAQKALREWQESELAWRTQGSRTDFTIGVRIMKMMAAVGLEKEWMQVRDDLKQDPNYAQNNSYRNMLRQAENEIAISQGKEGDLSAVLTWSAGPGQGTLIWDVRPAGGSESGDQTIWMADKPTAKLSGTHTLEVYFGENENSMKRILSKPAAPARGSWTGSLPKPSGYLRAVLKKGEEMRFGPPVAAANGTALLPADLLDQVPSATGGNAKGWSGIPMVPASLTKGGPSGQTLLHLDGDPQNQMDLIAERVAIDPKKNYLVGCWFRFPENEGNTRVGWRIYDADGKELNSYSGNGNFQANRWNYALQRLGRGRNFSSIPEKAAWIEPYVQFSGRCDLQGMFITEIGTGVEED